jgi:hypothetical protein
MVCWQRQSRNSTAEDLGDDNIIDEDEIMVDDDDLDGI